MNSGLVYFRANNRTQIYLRAVVAHTPIMYWLETDQVCHRAKETRVGIWTNPKPIMKLWDTSTRNEPSPSPPVLRVILVTPSRGPSLFFCFVTMGGAGVQVIYNSLLRHWRFRQLHFHVLPRHVVVDLHTKDGKDGTVKEINNQTHVLHVVSMKLESKQHRLGLMGRWYLRDECGKNSKLVTKQVRLACSG
jgi:hypothetical protein